MTDNLDRGAIIIAFGVLLLLAGVMMPSSVTKETTVCTDPGSVNGYEYCEKRDMHDVETETKNDFKAPAIVSGAAIIIVGASLHEWT